MDPFFPQGELSRSMLKCLLCSYRIFSIINDSLLDAKQGLLSNEKQQFRQQWVTQNESRILEWLNSLFNSDISTSESTHIIFPINTIIQLSSSWRILMSIDWFSLCTHDCDEARQKLILIGFCHPWKKCFNLIRNINTPGQKSEDLVEAYFVNLSFLKWTVKELSQSASGVLFLLNKSQSASERGVCLKV